MSQGGGGSSKPKGVGHEEIVTLARRSPRHSSLFWYLFDQHDELIEAKKQSGLGIPWESMLPRFAALNLTLWKGKAITPRGAEQTFLRVQKKKARLAALEAQAEAVRDARREADPRRNMPSRFKGSFPAYLADRQPPLATTSSTAKPPAMNSVPTRPEGGRPRCRGRADRSHPHRMDQSGRDDFDAFGSADARGAGADRGLGGTAILGGFDHHSRQ